ncbi:MAG: hypothetical protein CMO26_15015 [Thiotrichales bacterium]|nr:hypothetical protein [Thiotrichales bacterium]|tara:strand:+ start:213 stop:1190 length:978 start_codon:yes stop_codon:yes gene_type:complete
MTTFSIMTGIDPTKPVTDVIDYAKSAEAHGFHALWIWDTWFSTDAFVSLTLAAVNTERLLLGNGVAATPVRHPSMLVSSVSTLDNLSGGRALCGIGCGGQATVGRIGKRKAKIAEFRKDLLEMQTLFSGKDVEGDGVFYKVDTVRRPAPIYTAAWGPRMLEVSAQHADGVIIMAPDQKDVLKLKIERIKKAAAESGRDPSEVKIVFGLTCDYSDDPQPIIDRFKSLAVHYIQRTGYEDEYPDHYRKLLDDVRKAVPLIAYPEGEVPNWEMVPDDFVKYHLTVGTEKECLEHLRELMTLEPDEVVFSAGFADIEQVPKWANLISQL